MPKRFNDAYRRSPGEIARRPEAIERLRAEDLYPASDRAKDFAHRLVPWDAARPGDAQVSVPFEVAEAGSGRRRGQGVVDDLGGPDRRARRARQRRRPGARGGGAPQRRADLHGKLVFDSEAEQFCVRSADEGAIREAVAFIRRLIATRRAG